MAKYDLRELAAAKIQWRLFPETYAILWTEEKAQ
jgi:hypothetical protein